MNFKNLTVILFISILPAGYCNFLPTVAECSPSISNIPLNPGDSRIVQTAQFPQSLTSENSNATANCTFRFVRNGDIGTVYLIFTNGYAYDIARSTPFGTKNEVFSVSADRPGKSGQQIESKNGGSAVTPILSYDSNADVTLLRFQNASTVDVSFGPKSANYIWTAFQGFVFAEKINVETNCLMNGQTFDLKDNSGSVPVYGILNHYNKNEACTWGFTIPDGYQLKVDTVAFSLMTNENVAIHGDNGVTAINAKGVQYISGKTFTIVYNKIASSDPYSTSGFGALVSISGTQNSQMKCLYNLTNDESYFGNFDPVYGYAANSHCDRTVAGRQNSILNLDLVYSYVEFSSDKINVKSTGIDYNMAEFDTVNVESQDDVHVNFQSDLSTNQAGYQIHATYIPCTCPKSLTVPCDGVYPFSFAPSLSYCSMLNCNFPIVMNSNCPSSGMLVQSGTLFRKGTNDTFTLSVNGQMVYQVNTVNDTSKFTTVTAGSKVEATFQSGLPASKVYKSPLFYLYVSSTNLTNPAATTTTTPGKAPTGTTGSTTTTTSTASSLSLAGFLIFMFSAFFMLLKQF